MNACGGRSSRLETVSDRYIPGYGVACSVHYLYIKIMFVIMLYCTVGLTLTAVLPVQL